VEYDCQIILATKILTDFNKVVKPLCSTCTNHSCTNPISEKKISVFGQVYTGRLFCSGDSYFMVTRCDGYRGETIESEEDDDEDENGGFEW
jgi:hypothetical protein